MSSAWRDATTMLATMAVVAVGALSVGCGPAPGYEPEPRMPVGYTTMQGEPPTSEELAARAEARQNASVDAVAEANGEVALGAEGEQYADTDPSALTEWKPALEGHGQWVDDSTYGTVWVPAAQEVGTDFQPYVSAGHWTYDDATSWVWVSDYSWGWAPFHYGRWVNVNRHGWAWIPGRTYAGAWVVWRTGGADYEYVGWAPAGPDWYWYNGVAVGWTWGWSPSYSYCHHDYLYDRGGVHGHVVRGPGTVAIEGRTRPYVPASPTVGGGGRVAASPTVGGSGRVAAEPTVGAGGAGGSRVAATPRVGPHPSELGIRAESVAKPPSDNPGLARATAMSTPHTAIAQGAAPPVGMRRRSPEPSAFAGAGAPARFGGDRMSPAVSSRMEAAARAPQVAGVSNTPPRAMSDSSRSSFGSTPGMAAARPVPSFAPQARTSPSFTAPTQSNPPAFRSSPSMTSSSPTFRSSPTVSSPTFRSSPTVSSSPTFRSSPTVSSSSTFRSSPTVSSPTFRSSPTVSSSPSRASSPTVRSSSPSRSAPSRGGRR